MACSSCCVCLFASDSLSQLTALLLLKNPAQGVRPSQGMYKPVQVLSKKSTRQNRNVFIWCTYNHKVALVIRFDSQSPTSS